MNSSSMFVAAAFAFAGTTACGGRSEPTASTTPAAAEVSVAPRAPAQEGFGGEWRVTWLDNMSVNPLTLQVQGQGVTGQYISDDGEVCPVRGELSDDRTTMRITVACARWDILMQGQPGQDAPVEGNYLAYGNSRGRFTMARP